MEVDFEWKTEIEELFSPILTFNKTQMGISFWNLETFLSDNNDGIHIKLPVLKYGNTSAFGLM